MKFRISDLILLTTIVAGLSGVFQTDAKFFRQLFCLCEIAVFATAVVMIFCRPNVRKTGKQILR